MFKVIKELLFGKRIEFDTTYSLHEVHDRLQSMSERDYVKLPFWKSKYRLLRVRMERIDKQSFRFVGNRAKARNLMVVARGTVTQNMSGVQVTGKVHLGWLTLVILTPPMIIWLMFSLGLMLWIWSFPTSYIAVKALIGLIPIFIPIAVLLPFWILKDAQNQLYDQIHDVLEKAKWKNTESVEIQLFKDHLKR